jgi:Rps23 Pro-64 3,4-dihydroxylase Tpa1-like proline 4-hydroxylase
MYEGRYIIDKELLDEIKDDFYSGSFSVTPSQVSTGTNGYLSNDRTSTKLEVHRTWYPEFCEQMASIYGELEVTQIDVLHYDKGQKFVKHYDRIIGEEESRIYTTVSILELSDDFEGDGLVLYSSEDDDVGYSPKIEEGQTIVFPADHWHAASPVVKGTRLVVTAWLGRIQK